MIKRWSPTEIKNQIDEISFAESDPYMDGFIKWTCKRELYMIYWYLEKKLDKCSTYAGEEKFIEDHELDKMWDILKDD